MSKVTITTAVKLSANQLENLSTAIEKKHGKSSIETVVDPSILGGIVITIGSHQIDNSYWGRINTMKQHILTAIAE